MDVEELRQSQRRMKKPNHKLPIVTLSATSVSGSGQDSDDDEDEVCLHTFFFFRKQLRFIDVKNHFIVAGFYAQWR